MGTSAVPGEPSWGSAHARFAAFYGILDFLLDEGSILDGVFAGLFALGGHRAIKEGRRLVARLARP